MSAVVVDQVRHGFCVRPKTGVGKRGPRIVSAPLAFFGEAVAALVERMEAA